MPYGISTDICATFVGAILGVLIGKKLPEDLKQTLNNILGIAAITMGIVLIMRNHQLTPVVLAIIIGAIIGELIRLEKNVNKGVSAVVGKLMKGTKADEGFLIQVSAVVILFCFGGTGWYGALNEGMTADGSILVTKSILDFATAVIFGSLLGWIVPALCVPQVIVYFALFFIAKLVAPFITGNMIGDFSAAGGMITLCAGLRLTGIKKDLKVLNLLPALILVFFLSAAWTALTGL